MTVSDGWRQDYRLDRYLEHLSLDELEQRVRDIFTNVSVLSEDGKLSLPPVEKGTGYWMQLFTHVLEEFALRGHWVRPGFKRVLQCRYQHGRKCLVLLGPFRVDFSSPANSCLNLGNRSISEAHWKMERFVLLPRRLILIRL
jgi:hypothetical protein